MHGRGILVRFPAAETGLFSKVRNRLCDPPIPVEIKSYFTGSKVAVK